MLVIADTTPLNYLILLDAIELLPRLYPQVILPHGAWLELQQAGAPPVVAHWARALPDWIEVREAPLSSDPALAALGAGEREAITLAELYRSQSAVLLLLDEQAARQLAEFRRLPATGTLGILKAAAAAGWIDLAAVFVRLRQTNFRASASLLQTLLDEEVLRQNKPE
jgi:predicted nucleic acid-binding protein